MKRKKSHAEDSTAVAALVADRMSCEVESLRCTCLQTDFLAEVWKIDGWKIPLILRMGPNADADRNRLLFYEQNMMERELVTLALVKERTSIPIPEIFCHEAPCPEFGRTITLMECMQGHPVHFHGQHLGASFIDSMLTQLARIARELHTITSDKYGYVGGESIMPFQDDWASAFYLMLEGSLIDCVRQEFFTEEDKALMLEVYEHLRPAFELVEKPCLVHGDLWHGNILVDNNARILGIIDWDTAIWADPAMDFYVLDLRCFNRVAFRSSYRSNIDWQSRDYNIRLKFYRIYGLIRTGFVYGSRTTSHSAAVTMREAIMAYVRELKKM